MCRMELALDDDELARTNGVRPRARGAGTRRPARATVIGRRANMAVVVVTVVAVVFVVVGWARRSV